MVSVRERLLFIRRVVTTIFNYPNFIVILLFFLSYRSDAFQFKIHLMTHLIDFVYLFIHIYTHVALLRNSSVINNFSKRHIIYYRE